MASRTPVHVALLVLAAMSSGGCATGGVGAGATAPSVRWPSAAVLAADLIAVYESTTALTVSADEKVMIYETTGAREWLEDAPADARIVAAFEGWAESRMTPSSFELRAWHDADRAGRPEMTLALRNGTVTERQWHAERSAYEVATYPARVPGGTPDITLPSPFYERGVPADVKICSFANLFRTWLGTPTPVAQRVRADIGRSTVVGMETIDGRRAYRLEQSFAGTSRAGGATARRDRLWIDVEHGWLVQWHTDRRAYDPAADVTAFMRERRRYRYEVGGTAHVD